MRNDKIEMHELLENNRNFRFFMEVSIEPIWWFEIDEPYSIDLAEDVQVELLFNRAYIKKVNKAYAEVVGYERPEDLYGLYFHEFIPPSKPENVNTVKRAVRARYSLRDFETIEYYKNKKFIIANNVQGLIED